VLVLHLRCPYPLRSRWAIPTATDIPLAWAIALMAFGRGHPAISYLLLLAVVDDAVGMIIIAIFYPGEGSHPEPVYLMLVVLAMFMSWIMRRLAIMDFRL
jgi:NhaA family Na+:H+ antiporter